MTLAIKSCLDGTSHELIPSAWKIGKETRKVTSFVCQKCFTVVHAADIFAHCAKSSIDTSERHLTQVEQSSLATQQPHT